MHASRLCAHASRSGAFWRTSAAIRFPPIVTEERREFVPMSNDGVRTWTSGVGTWSDWGQASHRGVQWARIGFILEASNKCILRVAMHLLLRARQHFIDQICADLGHRWSERCICHLRLPGRTAQIPIKPLFVLTFRFSAFFDAFLCQYFSILKDVCFCSSWSCKMWTPWRSVYPNIRFASSELFRCGVRPGDQWKKAVQISFSL